MHEGHAFVAVIIVLLTSHLWAARFHVGAAVRGAVYIFRRWAVAKTKLATTNTAQSRFHQRWEQVRIQQFKSVTTITTHVAGLLLLALLLCTDAWTKICSGSTRELTILTTYAVGYACLLLNYAISPRLSRLHVDLFYAGFLLLAINSVLNIEAGPTFFLLRGNDALAQGVLALTVMDIRRSSIGGALYAISCCASYLRNITTFRDHDDRFVASHAQYFIFWEFALWLFSCGGAYVAEYWLKASVMANVQTEDVQQAFQRVLSALCDAVVHLNTDLLVQNPTQQLLHMLAPNANGNASILQDKKITDFIVSDEDRERFVEFTSVPSADGWAPGSGSTAAAAHIQLRDVTGQIFRADLFHTYLQDSITPFHLIGIRLSESRCEHTEDDLFQAVPARMLSNFERGVSGSEVSDIVQEGRVVTRGSLASTMGAPTESGLTHAQDMWRCPRCGASRQDWGDAVSLVSGFDDNASLHHRMVRHPGDEPPPVVGQADRQTVSNHFTSLFEWAPAVCQQVLSETRSTYSVVHRAAAALQDEEKAQYIQSVQSRVANLLLIGSRLENHWPGFRSIWGQIIYMVTGAQAVPLRGIMQVPSSRAWNNHNMMAWQLPSFTASHISSDWWGMEPQDMYNRVRSEVMAYVASSQGSRRRP